MRAQPLQVVVRRDGRPQTLTGTVTLGESVQYGITADPNASAKALRIRNGIFRGTTDAAPAAR